MARMTDAPAVDPLESSDKNCKSSGTGNTSVDSTSSSGKMTAVELLREFSSTTTMHGLGRAMSEPQRWRRLLWWTLLLGASAWSTYNVKVIVEDFMSNPIITRVSKEFNSELDFPTITFCNLNRFRYKESPKEVKTLLSNLTDAGKSETFIESKLDTLVFPYEITQKKKMGHQLEDMLISCVFHLEECWYSNFTVSYNHRYGNCFTFAGFQNPDRSSWLSVKAGPTNGLVLELNVEIAEYMAVSATAGVLVMVHDFNVIPYPEDGGLIVAPGSSTSIGVTKTTIHRQKPPYGECVSTNEGNALGFMGTDHYTMYDCFKECLQLELYLECECCVIDFPCVESTLISLSGITPEEGSIQTCNESNPATGRCVNRVTDDFHHDNFACSGRCPPACTESTFQAMISTGEWPTAAYDTILRNKVSDAGISINSSSFDQLVVKSFLRLEIYYDTLIVDSVHEEPAYTWSKLLGDIGGQLGLLLGCSIMTAVEIVELLLDLGPGLWWANTCGRDTKVGHGQESNSY